MAIPGYQKFMFPILKFLYDGQTKSRTSIFNAMSKTFKLTTQQLNETLPSQTQPTYKNRIGWAITYLKKAGLLISPTRANFQITDEGKKIVDNNITNLDSKYLEKYEPFVEFQNLSRKQDGMQFITNNQDETPLENIVHSFEILKKDVCDELLNKILDQSFDFFEQLVVDLIVAMGYGGSVEDAGRATKKTNDEGVDGVIKEDKLGLDNIYLQAKRWQKANIVGRPEIQKFVGALAGQGARKGIFITTSSFTKDALEYKPRNDTSIILIDGIKLVVLMYEHNIGVATERKFEVKHIDNDYFESV